MMGFRARRSRGCRGSPVPAAPFLAAGAFLASSAFLAVLGLLDARSAQATPPATEPRTVTIENLQFTPQTLTVHRGDRIVWVNKDLFPHTVTASGKEFDSQSIAPNAAWTYVARKSGKFGYSCTFHPTMKGTLVVH